MVLTKFPIPNTQYLVIRFQHGPLHKAIHAAEFIFIILVAAHEVEGADAVLGGPADQVRQQQPAGGVTAEFPVPAGVIEPDPVLPEEGKVGGGLFTPQRVEGDHLLGWA